MLPDEQFRWATRHDAELRPREVFGVLGLHGDGLSIARAAAREIAPHQQASMRIDLGSQPYQRLDRFELTRRAAAWRMDCLAPPTTASRREGGGKMEVRQERTTSPAFSAFVLMCTQRPTFSFQSSFSQTADACLNFLKSGAPIYIHRRDPFKQRFLCTLAKFFKLRKRLCQPYIFHLTRVRAGLI